MVLKFVVMLWALQPERSASRSSSIWCKCQNQGARKASLSSQQTVELVHELTNTQNLGVDPVSVIHGGNERGTYVCKELVYAYAMWISPSFHLKVIRTFDMVTSAPEKLSGQAADKMQAGVILLDFMRRVKSV